MKLARFALASRYNGGRSVAFVIGLLPIISYDFNGFVNDDGRRWMDASIEIGKLRWSYQIGEHGFSFRIDW